MSIRLQDIAQQLGLSVSTVSLALRGAPQVAEETRTRVLDAAMELGYVQRPRQVPSTKIAQMAFIAPLEQTNIFYSSVLSGAEHECQRNGIALHYGLLEEVTPRALERYAEVDGLLVVGSFPEAVVMQLKALGRPMVLVDNNLPYLGLDRVLIENTGSVYRVVTWLASQGHERIAFLCGPHFIPSFAERLRGYRMAVGDLGLEPIEIPNQGMDQREIEQAISDSLEPYGRPPYTALVVFYDVAAVHALHVLQDKDVLVPQDVSLVGFDDVVLARMARPSLATCHVHRELLGKLGVQRLVERAAQPDAPPLALTIDTVLVEGASVQPLEVSVRELHTCVDKAKL